MRTQTLIVLFFCIVISSCVKKDHPPFRQLGDYAPPLHIREWVKGTPVKDLEEGKVYVLEFWATWCRPCMASMPHLSALAKQYKDKVTFLAIDVYERDTTSIEDIRTVIKKMGKRMDFNVGLQDSNLMEQRWLKDPGEAGLPTTIVVDAAGRVAWTGHPLDLGEVLPDILNNTWDIHKELSKRISDKYLDSLDRHLDPRLFIYAGDFSYTKNPNYREKPDSVLVIYNEIIKKEPKLKYAQVLSMYAFSAMLKTDPGKALEYGKKAMKAPGYNNYDASYNSVIFGIENNSKKINLPAEIYRLGAEAYQMRINRYTHWGYPDLSKEYNQMADWYRRAGDEVKAIAAEQQAASYIAAN
jgi:thiol-disulfide isomerase/thioredoxin